MAEPLIVAVDIGTSSVRALGFDAAGTVRFGAQTQLETDHPRPGWSEQDPDAVATATVETLRTALASAPDGSPLQAVTFSAQMYSILAIDGAGRPLTKSLPWTDIRAAAEAMALRERDVAGALVAETGCPLQPIYPLAKIRWLLASHDLPGDVRFVTIKDYVIAQLTGRYLTDWSTASATGLLDIAARRWSAVTLDAAGLTEAQLPPLDSPTAILDDVKLSDLGLGTDTVLVLGAGDAPLSSIGSGATDPAVLAVNIGTSAAARRFSARPDVDRSGRLWTYVATDENWITGGIIGSAGSVYDWIVGLVLGDTGDDAHHRAVELAATVPPGSEGLLFLPYFAGEQSPRWRLDARGAVSGLGLHHGKAHLLRAALEGIALALQRVRLSIDEVSSSPIREVAVTGRVAAAPLVRQLLADVLGLPVVVPKEHEGSARGAAILAAAALGLITDIRAVDGPGWAQTPRVHPSPQAHDQYQAVYADFVSASHKEQP
ncbi:MAG: gluconokinase [Acidimicrobiia bacterium]|nr:gluconokinase [Acidimicrobiia bacterium]